MTMKKIQILFIFVLSFLMNLNLARADTWGAPPGNPPSGNRPQPIDVSAQAQTKTGDLYIQGNVGIGTVSPGSQLEIQDSLGAPPTIRLGTIADQNVVQNSVLGQLVFTADDGSQGYVRVQSGAIKSIAYGDGSPLRWGGGGTDGAGLGLFVLKDNSDASLTEAVRIDYLGNVGIGTATPEQKLEVRDNTSGAARLRIADTVQNPELQLKYGDGANDHWSLYVNNTSNHL